MLQGCLLELALFAPDAAPITNPYNPNEVDAQVRFNAPDGTPKTVAAFYFTHPQDASQNGWRVRFTPTQAGAWQATATWRTPIKILTSSAIAFNVAQRASPGMVRRHPKNPRYFAFDSGETFFSIGVNLAWHRNDALREYEAWFDAMHANGANTARIWMAHWAFGLEWRDTGLGHYHNRQHRAFWLDAVLRMAEQRNIYLVIGLIPDIEFRSEADGQWRDNPYNAANGGPCHTPQEFVTSPAAQAIFQQRLRYIAARWGYSTHILAWELWNEVESTRIETPLLKPWVAHMAQTLRTFDVNDHLLGISYLGNGDNAIWAMPEIDFAQRHEYNPNPKWFNPIAGGFRLTPDMPNKPLLFGEFGATPHSEQLNAATREGIHLHNGLWASAFNGFASAAMYWWWDDYIHAGNLWPRFKGLSQFLQGEDLAAMSYLSSTITPPNLTAMALSNASHTLLWLRDNAYNHADATFRYSVSRSTGQPYVPQWHEQRAVQLQLQPSQPYEPSQRYRIEWWDTQQGHIRMTDTLQATGSTLTLAVPSFTGDIAAKIFPL